MNKTVKIEGLDCPNCARALQNEINKIDGVSNVKIDFIKSSLYFESENADEAFNKIIKLTAELEPQARITDKSKSTGTKILSKTFLIDIITLVLGLGLGAVLMFSPVNKIKWLYITLYVVCALLLGYKTYYKAIKQLFKGVINENLLVTISVVGASIVSEHFEGLMVIALYSIGKIFEGLAVNRSRRSIEKLARLQPEYAVILNSDGSELKVEPKDVKVGTTILVKAGEKVPLDGIIVEGEGAFDLKSLTGESVPVEFKEGSEILSGAVSLNGVVKIKTTKEAGESAIAKIMNLVEKASENKSKTETFISKLTKWYTLGIVVLALSVFGIVWAVTKNVNLAVYRGLIFLVISCPCAFAISVPLSYFSGIGNASKNGILIKGSNYLDVCSRLNCVAFDKTGTLTTGEFTVKEIKSLDKNKSEEDILFLSALGERYSLHPLAKSIVKTNNKPLEDVSSVNEIAGAGVEFSYKKNSYFVGRRDKTLKQTTVELYENNKKIGEIILSDTIKSQSKQTCLELNAIKVKTCMLSGDSAETVNSVANEIGVNKAYGELLPEEKYAWIEQNKNKNNVIGYVGDGINDAPSLTVADVGISMGISGSPASIEASDIVLVDDNPAKIVTAIKISKYTKRIVLENIILSAIVKLAFLTLGSVGITGMLAAVFADVGVTLLAILNSMRALTYKPNKTKKAK